jgi:sodium transport system permease protein
MIFTIFKKELIDTLRDRRTLMMMLVIPVLVFPIIMNLFVTISASFQKEAASKTLNIGVLGSKDNPIVKDLIAAPEALGKKKVVFYTDTALLRKDIEKDSVQLGLFVHDDAAKLLETFKPIAINWLFDGTDLGMQERAELYMGYLEDKYQNARYQALKINPVEVKPFFTVYSNVASDQKMIGQLAGGFLPYIFIAFGFIGCMYPAIDLFTGEKERGTIETLLTTPVARWQILFGKMIVVVLSGLTAATCALLGLYFSIEFMNVVENAEIMAIVKGILSVKFILTLFLLLFPLTIFFAGVMIPIAVYAKTFKEAQSIITPLNIVVVLPAMVGFFPGIELNAITACIPVVNVVLSSKELIAGTLEWGCLALSFGVMLSLAMLSVFVSYKQYGKESNVIVV